MGKTRALALLIPYLLFLFYVTLIFHTVRHLGPEQRLNLVPFQTIAYFVVQAEEWSRHPSSWAYYNILRGVGVNVVGNLTVFMPLGFLLPAPRRRPTSAWHALGAGAALSTAIEVLQFCSARRTADVDDVLLNALGAVLGFGCLVVLRGRERSLPGAVSVSGREEIGECEAPAEPIHMTQIMIGSAGASHSRENL